MPRKIAMADVDPYWSIVGRHLDRLRDVFALFADRNPILLIDVQEDGSTERHEPQVAGFSSRAIRGSDPHGRDRGLRSRQRRQTARLLLGRAWRRPTRWSLQAGKTGK